MWKSKERKTIKHIRHSLSIVFPVYLFEGLYDRFQPLLCAHCCRYALDFLVMSRSNFDTICERYLSQMVDQIPSIRFYIELMSSRMFALMDQTPSLRNSLCSSLFLNFF